KPPVRPTARSRPPTISGCSSTPVPWNSNARRSFVLCLLLSAATVGAYGPVNRFAFIDLDDPEYVTLNPYIAHGFGWHGVLWAFQTGRAGNWHPLTWL